MQLVLGRYDFGFPSKTYQDFPCARKLSIDKAIGRRGGGSTPRGGGGTRFSGFYSDLTKRLPIINPRKKNAAAIIIE